MVLEYRNKYGVVRLLGGGNGRYWRISEITGLGLPPKNFTYNSYAGVFGRTLSSVTMPCRTITISGDITKEACCYLPMGKAMKILNEDGELFLQVGRTVRRAKVRTVSFEAEECAGMFRKFTWQIESDNPYFWGETEKAKAVSERTALLKTSFVLPCKFSSFRREVVLVNSGDVAAEPVLELKKPLYTEIGSGGIVIKNETTGVSVVLEYDLSPGEVVVIDIPKRKVTSSVNGNLVGYLSLDTVLRSFVLGEGENRISAECADGTVSVACSYCELFLEACYNA